MANTILIPPIFNRTEDDTIYARQHQASLETKHIGAWNYVDMNRVCNNLQYAAERMYEIGWLSAPYPLQLKLDWVETDKISYEQLNTMVVKNMNNLILYSDQEILWHPISAIANMDYVTANQLEQNIFWLATQDPPAPDTYELSIRDGDGSGRYEPGTVVPISAYSLQGEVFQYWAGDHPENIEDIMSPETNYTMPSQNASLYPVYNHAEITHTLTVNTETIKENISLLYGEVYTVSADPAPLGKVFYDWEVSPEEDIILLERQSATATITMPNHNVSLKAVYIDRNKKQLAVWDGTGSGQYEYNTLVAISANPPAEGYKFSKWTGDTQYLLSEDTNKDNIVRIPDQPITALVANYKEIAPPTPPAIKYAIVTVREGTFDGSGESVASIQFDSSAWVQANPPPVGYIFDYWSYSWPSIAQGWSIERNKAHARLTVGEELTPGEAETLATIEAHYRQLVYANLTLVTGVTTATTYESADSVYLSALPFPEGMNTFIRWEGDIAGISDPTDADAYFSRMGTSDRIVRGVYEYIPIIKYALTVETYSGTEIRSLSPGELFSITPFPAPEGSTFKGWAGDTNNLYRKNPTTWEGNMYSRDRFITAVYRGLEYYILTVTNGITTYTSRKEIDEYVWLRDYFPGRTATQEFDHWEGDVPPALRDTWDASFAMGNADRHITVIYHDLPTYTVTIVQPSGTTTQTKYKYGKVDVTREAPPSENYIFSHWLIQLEDGSGKTYTQTNPTLSYTDDADATVTSVYSKLWTATVINGYLSGASIVSDNVYRVAEGHSYALSAGSILPTHKFTGWELNGAGRIDNPLSIYPLFYCGAGNSVITCTSEPLPDKTVKIYMIDPFTHEYSLISETTYRYNASPIVYAPVAPEQTTFLSWLGDVDMVTPSVYASTVQIKNLTKNVTLTATYYIPDELEYYSLTVQNGSPSEGTYPAGEGVVVRAIEPSEGWVFYKWEGDVQFLTGGIHNVVNIVMMPKQDISLIAKFKKTGEDSCYRLKVTNGTAYVRYPDTLTPVGSYDETGVDVNIPVDSTVKLYSDVNVTPGWVFSYWEGNFEEAGLTGLTVTDDPLEFSMPEHDVNAMAIRREEDTYTVYTTNALGPGTVPAGTYTIVGNLPDTQDLHYVFSHWTCVNADKINWDTLIDDVSSQETTLTINDEDLWIEAVYTTYYKLTVAGGQDTGTGYYAENEVVATVYANDPPTSDMMFSHWDDPLGIVSNIYDATPTITMKNSTAIITAVFVEKSYNTNNVFFTNNNLRNNQVTNDQTNIISGALNEGALGFDTAGNIGAVTELTMNGANTELLFYGGGFNVEQHSEDNENVE